MKKILLLLLFVSSNLYSQEFEKGKTIFEQNCTSCHKMDAKLVGPPLQDVVETQGRDWVSKWISNSQVLIESGDAHANEIYKEYNQMAMPSYSFLAEDELSALVDYLEGYKANAATAPTPETSEVQSGGDVVSETSTSSGIPTYIWVFIIITLVVLLLCAIVIVAAIKILDNYFTKMSINNSHLMKKLNLGDKQVETEVDTLIEKEVSKRVTRKLKVIKTEIDKNFKK